MVTDADFLGVLNSLASTRQQYDKARSELEDMKRRREQISDGAAVMVNELDAQIGQSEMALAEMLKLAGRMGITIDGNVITS